MACLLHIKDCQDNVPLTFNSNYVSPVNIFISFVDGVISRMLSAKNNSYPRFVLIDFITYSTNTMNDNTLRISH